MPGLVPTVALKKPRKLLTEEDKAARKRARQAAKYGLTVEQLDKLEAIERCSNKACGRKPKPGKNLYTDHDHATGRVRGRLCFT